MSRQIHIAAMVLAVLMLLLVTVTPHHHHNDAACVYVEHCEKDNTDNDKHTRHHSDGTQCIEKGAVIEGKIQTLNNIPAKVIPDFIAVLNIIRILFFSSSVSQIKTEQIISYQLPYTEEANYLRAPPRTLI